MNALQKSEGGLETCFLMQVTDILLNGRIPVTCRDSVADQETELTKGRGQM